MTNQQVQAVSWIAVWTLIAVLVAVGVIDLVLVRYQPNQGTVSSTIWQLARDYPVVAFAIGVLVGHLLWPQHG
jgi:hypothetical protein